jgi:hypothetical protein
VLRAHSPEPRSLAASERSKPCGSAWRRFVKPSKRGRWALGAGSRSNRPRARRSRPTLGRAEGGAARQTSFLEYFAVAPFAAIEVWSALGSIPPVGSQVGQQSPSNTARGYGVPRPSAVPVARASRLRDPVLRRVARRVWHRLSRADGCRAVAGRRRRRRQKRDWDYGPIDVGIPTTPSRRPSSP